MSASSELRAAARRAGVITEYIGIGGATIRSSDAALRGVLSAIGELADPTATRYDTIVAWDGQVPRLPSGTSIVLESGVEVPATGRVPLGYHRTVRRGAPLGHLIAAPRWAPTPEGRQWGVLSPLYSLRRDSHQPLATYPDISTMFDWLHRRGGRVFLTLPLLPLFLDQPADWSPYSPVSRRFWNELYVDLAPYGAGPADDEPRPVDRLLDYPEIYRRFVERLDRVAAEMWFDAGFQRYLAEHPLLARYAAFRAAQAMHGRNWRAWREPQGTLPARRDAVVERRHLVGCWLADRQLAAVAGTAESRGQYLALDVALGTHADGFDTWDEGDLFVTGASVGAPPDPIFRSGQDWGFPPVHPARSRATGHRYFRDTLRHHLQYARLLRLDHVMGLLRQWWVPHGLASTDGAYVRYPLDELLAVTCLEAHLAGAVVVGENLGIVPPEIDAGLAEHHLLGIYVAVDDLPSYGTGGPRRSKPTDVAMLTTHDGVPFAGWWDGLDSIRANEQGLIDDAQRDEQLALRAEDRERVMNQLQWDGRLHERGNLGAVMVATVEDLAAQQAPVVIYNIEDFWLEPLVQNTPGTFQELPNWRRTAALTLEEIERDGGIDETVRRVAALRPS